MRKSWFLVPPTVIGLAVVGWLIWLPDPAGLATAAPDTTAVMLQRLRQAASDGRSYPIRHTPVPLSRISPHLVRAVLLAEDARFYSHEGVDWSAIREELQFPAADTSFSWTDPGDLRETLRAVDYYLEHRQAIKGRSTITQQLAKNLYFGTRRSLLRKVNELVVVGRMERALTKDRILELYLNSAEWGPGIFGAEAAARAYFHRPARDVDPVQAAALAATLPHPLTSNPGHRPGRMRWRQGLILTRMLGADSAATLLGPPRNDSVRAPASTVTAQDSLGAALPPGTAPATPVDTVPAPGDTVPRVA